MHFGFCISITSNLHSITKSCCFLFPTCFTSFFLFLPCPLSLPYFSPIIFVLDFCNHLPMVFMPPALWPCSPQRHSPHFGHSLTFEADQLLYYSKPLLHRVKSKCQSFHRTAPSPPLLEWSHLWPRPFALVICHIQHSASHLLPLPRPSLPPRMLFSKLRPIVVLHSHTNEVFCIHSFIYSLILSFFCSVVMDRLVKYRWYWLYFYFKMNTKFQQMGLRSIMKARGYFDLE